MVKNNYYNSMAMAGKIIKQKDAEIKSLHEQIDGSVEHKNRLYQKAQELQQRIKALENIQDYQPKKRWLKFLDRSVKRNKTKKILVKNKINDCGLGWIEWYGGWRQYVFDDGEIRLAEGCIYEIFEKVLELRLAREKEANDDK